jgi:hypothetical protein
LSGLTGKEVADVTVNLLNFLDNQGLRVPKPKFQFIEEEVRNLGHLITKEKQRLSPEQIEGITSMLQPLPKRELQKFLQFIGYCRFGIKSYTFKTKTLYSKLLEEMPYSLVWKPEEILIIENLSL